MQVSAKTLLPSLMTRCGADWNAASSDYGRHISPKFTPVYAQDLISRLELTQEFSVIEVAAGTGALTLAMAKKVDSILATDVSPDMISLLQLHLRERGISNVKTARMNGEQLSCAERSFDRAACMFGIMLFTSPERGVQQLLRTLKPGGKSVISVWGNPQRFELMQMCADGVSKCCPELPRPDLHRNPAFTLCDSDRLAEMMRTVGFKKILIDTVSRSTTFTSVEEFWSILFSAAPPFRKILAGVSNNRHTALKELIRKDCLSRFGPFPLELRTEALICLGES